MVFPGATIYQNIIKKTNNKFAEVGTEYVIYEALEGGRGIREPERHNLELVMALMSVKGGFVYVIGTHMYLVVCQA